MIILISIAVALTVAYISYRVLFGNFSDFSDGLYGFFNSGNRNGKWDPG
jgi:hypothetical protein